VIFLRFLDETELARLAQQTHLSLSLYRLDDPQMPDDFEVAQSSLSEQVPTFVKPLGANSVAGYGLMEDVYGDPAMMLRADMDRGIYRQGQNTVIWLIAFLAAASVAFAAVAIFLINRVLLSRIFAISDGVSKVRTTGDLSRRVPGKGKDEIDSLGANINRMLASLQESQRELLESEAQNSALVNAIPDMMFRMTKNGRLLDAKAFKSSIKKGFSTRPPFISDGGSSLQYDMLSIEVVQHGMPHVQRALETRETQIFEFALNFNGRVANYEARVALSGKDEALVMVRNITERKEAEEARKKEVLLKEIHHRVKNNLQVISSLLYLQSKRVDDQKVVEMFNESSNRIKSMSLIHQKLYQSQNAATIDFSEYIRDLTDALFNSYGIRRDVVRLNLHIESTILNVDTAIPCGLVINELVSNSLKYAFPDGKQGQIFISLRREGDDNFALVVGDTGIGLPKGLDFRDSPSLGLKLVNTLVEQLGGTIDLNREGGTEFRIIFSEIKQQSHNDAREPVRASSGTVG
jgi:two-component sensor histidine kinase/HAMP domain-containing protein